MNWIAPLLNLFSAIATIFKRKQLIDLGETKAENKKHEKDKKAQKDKRRIHSDIEHDSSIRERVRDFFRR